MVDKVIILLGRIISGGQGEGRDRDKKSHITKVSQTRFPCRPLLAGTVSFLPRVQRNKIFNKKEPDHPSPIHLLSPDDIHSKSKCILHSVRLALWREKR